MFFKKRSWLLLFAAIIGGACAVLLWTNVNAQFDAAESGSLGEKIGVSIVAMSMLDYLKTVEVASLIAAIGWLIGNCWVALLAFMAFCAALLVSPQIYFSSALAELALPLIFSLVAFIKMHKAAKKS